MDCILSLWEKSVCVCWRLLNELATIIIWSASGFSTGTCSSFIFNDITYVQLMADTVSLYADDMFYHVIRSAAGLIAISLPLMPLNVNT